MDGKKSNNSINLAIDAFNIKSGGGLSHLIEIIKSYKKSPKYFDKIIIFSSSETLLKLPNFKKVKKVPTKKTNNLIFILYWQMIILPKILKKENCYALLVPGGSSLTFFKKKFVMFRNMLPFDTKQLIRYKLSLPLIKFILLRLTLTLSFYFSAGIIFLTKEAKKVITSKIDIQKKSTVIISHGISKKFFTKPRVQKRIVHYSKKNKIKLLYVSNFDIYKNHTNLISAVRMLAKDNIAVQLNLVGRINTPYNFDTSKKIINLIESINYRYPQLIKISENIEYHKIHKEYLKSDIFVYASSCENMPNIVLESMASGLPIACSNYTPLKDILGKGALYFNPNDSLSIYKSLKKLINNHQLRSHLAKESFKKSQKYSWEESCSKLLKFIYIAGK